MFPVDSIVLLTGGPDRDGDFVGTGTNLRGKIDWYYLKSSQFVEVPGSTPLGVPESEAGPVEPEAPEPALKAALLEDHDTHATAEDQSRDVLRRELAAAVGNSSYDVSPMLAAVDRYVDSLPVEPTPQRRITLDDLTPRRPDQSDNDYRRMAVGELVGAATVAWDSMQHTGVFHEATALSIVDVLLELFDRQLSGLPHAQVEYVSAPLMDGMRGEALNHAVGIAKVSTNLGNMEATDTAGIVAQAEAFYAFLTGSSTPNSYPFEDGNVLVLGPELIAEPDGSVLNWKGQNYVTQPEPK